MTQMINKLNGLWDTVSGQVKLLASAIAGVIILFYVFKAFAGDDQDTKAAFKNIKRVVVLWLIIIFAPDLLSWLKTTIGA